MQNKRPIIFCTFSNDVESSLRLDQEERSIREALRELDKQQHIEHKSRGQVNLDDVYNEFNTYHNRIYIFHYGGHSDSEFLHLQEHHARSEQLAILIGQQKHLKLVFLNGCANRPQVQFLLDRGVPAVIATSESVHDKYACFFAVQFYEAFAGGKSIKEAFDAAKSYVQQVQNEIEFVTERGCRPRNPVEETMAWGLYYKEDAVLNWNIGRIRQKRTTGKILWGSLLFFFCIGVIWKLGWNEYVKMKTPLALTLMLKNRTPNPELPFEGGTISLQYGDKTDTQPIQTEANFKGIPANFWGEELALHFEANGFVTIDTIFELLSNSLTLPIRRDNSLGRIFGTVKDGNGNPLSGVEILVQDLSARSKPNGTFELIIQFDKQRKQQRVVANLKGYQPWDYTFPVSDKEEVSIILQK